MQRIENGVSQRLIPFITWRQIYRIPWITQNRAAVRTLGEIFYLLLALYRAQRLNDFSRLQQVFFRMLDAFAQYERAEAKDTVDQLLAIPWFASRKQNLYRLISAYNQIIKNMPEGRAGQSTKQQTICTKLMEEFVREVKILTDFDARDEARVSWLLATPEYMDDMFKDILENLR